MASATATLSTTPRGIDEPAITQMRNPFAAPFGSLVVSGAFAASDWPTLLRLKIISHPWSYAHPNPPLGSKCRPQCVNRFETYIRLRLCWIRISHHHELRLPNGGWTVPGRR